MTTYTDTAQQYWDFCATLHDRDVDLQHAHTFFKKVMAQRNAAPATAAQQLEALAQSIYSSEKFTTLAPLIKSMPETKAVDVMIARWFSPFCFDSRNCRNVYTVMYKDHQALHALINPLHEVKGMLNEVHISAAICASGIEREISAYHAQADTQYGHAEAHRNQLEIQDAVSEFIDIDKNARAEFAKVMAGLIAISLDAAAKIGIPENNKNLSKLQDVLNRHPDSWTLLKRDQINALQDIGLVFNEEIEPTPALAPITPMFSALTHIKKDVFLLEHAYFKDQQGENLEATKFILSDYVASFIPLAADFHDRIDSMQSHDACVALCVVALATPEDHMEYAFDAFCKEFNIPNDKIMLAQSIIASIERPQDNTRAIDQTLARHLYLDYVLANEFTRDAAHSALLHAARKNIAPESEVNPLGICASDLARALDEAANPIATPPPNAGENDTAPRIRRGYAGWHAAT